MFILVGAVQVELEISKFLPNKNSALSNPLNPEMDLPVEVNEKQVRN